jgi:hypothetical protein
MKKVTYQTFPNTNPNLPPEAADLFERLRFDMQELLAKISEDAKSNSQVDLNAVVEEAYLRSLVVAGVLMPLPDNSPLYTDASGQIH